MYNVTFILDAFYMFIVQNLFSFTTTYIELSYSLKLRYIALNFLIHFYKFLFST